MRSLSTKWLSVVSVFLLGAGTLFGQGDLTVDVTSNGGVVDEYQPAAGSSYPVTTTVIAGDHAITATPATDYKFVRWKITANDLNVTIGDYEANPTTVNITGNASIYAVFASDVTKSVELKVPDPLGGNPTLNAGGPATYTLSTGVRYDIAANPLQTYAFSGWTVTGGVSVKCASSESTYIEVTDAGTLEAKYTEKTSGDLTMAVNPSTNTTYKITGVSPGAFGYYDIAGDYDDIFIANNPFQATGTTNNDGVYTVSWSWTLDQNIGTITAATVATKQFVVNGAGDITPKIPVGTTITVGGSASNNGDYTVVSATYEGGTGNTTIVVNEAPQADAVAADGTMYVQTTRVNVNETIQDATVDGNLQVNAAGYAYHTDTLGWKYQAKSVYLNEWIDIEASPRLGYRFTGWTVTSGTATIAESWEKTTKAYITAASTITAGFEATSTATLTLAISPSDKGETTVGDIGAASTTNKYFRLDGYKNPYFSNGTVISVTGTDGEKNNGYYVVNNATNGTTNLGAITAVDATAKTFTVAGDESANVAADDIVRVRFSTGNDGYYTVTAVAYDGTTSTTITVSETVPDATADGTLYRMNYTYVYVYQAIPEASGTGSIKVNVPGSCSYTTPSGILTPTAATISTQEWYTIKATPGVDYAFTGWSVTSGNAVIRNDDSATASALILGDATLTASFAPTAKLTITNTYEKDESDVVIGQGTTVPADQSVTTVTTGQLYQIKATPDAASYFVKWSVTTGTATITADDAPDTFVTLSTDATVDAEFKKKADTTTNTLTVAVTPVDGGRTKTLVVGVHTLVPGTWYNIEAEAMAGYSFKKWTPTDSNVTVLDLLDLTTSVYLAGDATLTAEFEKDTETTKACLTIVMDPVHGGTESNIGAGTHTADVAKWYDIDANPEDGFKFVKWAVSSGSATLLDPYDDSTKVCVGSADGATVTATFTQDSAPTEYELSVAASPASGGDVEDSGGASIIGTSLVKAGTYYEVNADAANGYKFSSWTATGDVTVSGTNSEKAYIVVTGNATLTANFTKLTMVELTVAVSPETGGAEANFGAGVHTVEAGQWFTLDANPSLGYIFTGWTVSGGATVKDFNNTDTTAYLTADGSLTANFTFDTEPYPVVNLTIDSSPICGGTTGYWDTDTSSWDYDGTFTVYGRKGYNINATANTGYRFIGWKISSGSGNVMVADANDSSTTAMLTGDATLTAQYEQVPTASLTIAFSPENSGTESNFGVGTSTVNTKTWYTVDADPVTGYKFSSWAVSSGTATIVNIYKHNTQVCVTTDATITATFETATMAQLTMAVSPEGTGYINRPSEGAQLVSTGTYYTIEGVAAAGYTFTSWTVSENATLREVSTSKWNSVSISGDATVTANFSTTSTATLTMDRSPEYGGYTYVSWNSAGKRVVNTGEWIDIMADPTANFKFAGWTVSGSATILDVNEESTKVYLTGDATLTASFTPETTTTAALTIAADPECGLSSVEFDGTASFLGTRTVNTGKWYEIKATAKTTTTEGIGYKFSSWAVSSGSAEINYCTKDKKYYVYLTGDATITANLTTVSTATLTVAVTPDNSGVEENYGNGKHIVPINTWLNVYAFAYAGYKFKSWSVSENGMVIDDGPPYGAYRSGYIYLTGDTTLTVTFEAVSTATLTVAVTPEGSGRTYDYGLGTHTVNIGQRYYISAQTATGYIFKSWSIAGGTIYTDECDSGLYNTAYFIMTGDGTVTATFEAATTATLTMAASPEGAGTTTPNVGTYTYNVGQKYSISATAVCGYQFSKWTADGATLVDSTKSSTIAVLSGNATITAVFVSTPTSTLTLAASPAYALGFDNSMCHMYGGFFIADDFSTCSSSVSWQQWAPGAHTVYTNKKYLIRVTAIDSYKFKEWQLPANGTIEQVTNYTCWENSSCSCTGTEVWYYLTLTGDATLTAVFEEKTTAVLTTSIDAAAGGVVAMYDCCIMEYFDLEATTTVYVGDKYKLKAYTADGYYFWGWKVTSGNASISYNFEEDCFAEAYFVLTGDTTVQATFKTTAPTIPKLTMAVTSLFEIAEDGNGDPMIEPAVGTYNVQYAEPYDIKVTAASGYYFIRWTIDKEASGVFGSAVQASTTVTLIDDATVTPVFGQLVTDGLEITSLQVKTNNNNDSEKPKDSLKIKKAKMASIADLSNGLIFGVDGYEKTITTWTKEPLETDKKQVYEYMTDDKTFTLKLDKTNGLLDVTINKSDIFAKLSPANGIDVYLIIGNYKYGDSVTPDLKTTWKYKSDEKTDKILNFSAVYTKKNGATEKKDTFSVQGQGLTKPSAFDANTVVKVTFSGGATWELDPSDEEVTLKESGNKYQYKYQAVDKKTNPLKVQLTLDFDKKWSFKVSKSSQGSKLSVAREIVVTLEYFDSNGDTIGSEAFTIPPTDESVNQVVITTNLNYKK